MSAPRLLAELLAELPGAHLVRGPATAEVTGVEHDSRQVTAGSLFVAIPGFSVDGHTYLEAAAAAGAAAVLVQRGRAALVAALPPAIAVVEVEETRPALSRAAAWFYGHASRELGIIGITGTDGKTTTGHLLSSVLEASGARVGRLGTVDVALPGEQGIVGNRMTTPEAPEVQRLLRRMADAACDWGIVESTSHGLALHRLDDVQYDVAAFTNVTGDHLDFHRTFEAYREAKGLLFASLDRTAGKTIAKAAVVNEDDPSANFMRAQTRARSLSYGIESREADVRAEDIVLRPDGSDFDLVTPRGVARASIGLPALFNVANALAAAAIATAVGMAPADIARGLTASPGVPGRMERIVAGQPFEVIVDYAHTGDAVRKVLAVLRDVCRGQLLIVVGAAGERDPGRRFGVGRAAAAGADFAVFTSEDPRSEDPAGIVHEIGRHAEGAGRVRGSDFIEIEDRREAIAEAFRRARAGDVIVVCGKGHEKSMVYAHESRPWDDREVAHDELRKLGYSAG